MEPVNLQTLKKSRAVMRRVFTKTKNELESLLSVKKEELDMVKIQALLEVLDSHYQNISKQDSSVYDCLLADENIKDEEIDEEMNGQKEYAVTFQVMKKTVERLLVEEDRQSVSQSQRSSDQQVGLGLQMPNNCSFKLPLLKFKEFGGELKEWLPFWSQFSKIDSDNSISPNDKIQYLIMATIPNSEAREVVESYPATGDMYPEVVKALKSRFGREDLLTEYYIRELLKIIIYHASSTKKLTVTELYDKLQCHLRNLETLGVSADTCAPILLPLVSSCLPEDILKMWERSSSKGTRSRGEKNTSKDLLENLLTFLKEEIEGEQKVRLAMSGFGFSSTAVGKEKSRPSKFSMPPSPNKSSEISTAAGLFTSAKNEKSVGQGCIFCSMSHRSQDCIKAQSMPLSERKVYVNNKKACFCCLRPGHTASKCKTRPKCIICRKSHFVIMCDGIGQSQKQPVECKSGNETMPEPERVSALPKRNEALANLNSCNVLMQTLRVSVRGPNGVHCARALIDSASQRSYILSSLATKVGYVSDSQEQIQHSLFGGASTDVICHNVYVLHISSLDNKYSCHFEVLDQAKICGNISSVVRGPWIEELASQDIYFSDLDSNAPIEILIGADVAGNLWTGGHKPVSNCKLVAVETKLGWTLMGKIPNSHRVNENSAFLISSMLTAAKISDLWSLDTLGIMDPYEKQSRQELEAETQNNFLETVKITDEERFEVSLPWVEAHPPLPDNYGLAKKRLSSTVKKLKSEGLYEEYEEVFDGWEKENIIEEVPYTETGKPAHYLPHHPVLKPGSTTPVRPVFDASAHEQGSPSLNQCLEKGPNLLEKIPCVMARFRQKAVGVIADIRKAFLQIVLNERDRDFLRFLWLTNDGKLKTYRHCRVVFGVSSSPFLLEASIKLLMEETLTQCRQGKLNWPIQLVETLASSFYVDNCVCSLENCEKAQEFIEMASKIMNWRRFDLRGWELTLDKDSNENVSPSLKSNVLGLLWDRMSDTLEVNLSSLKDIYTEKITKRVILSTAHRIFDPIGFTCCVTLIPKLLLQRTWESGTSWDEEVDVKTKELFLEWFNDIHYLNQIKIPRWLYGTNLPINLTLHLFSDASQSSYASVAFLRVELEDHVRVQLIAAKSRVAPVNKSSKKMTIPRLELLSASISARLYSTIISDYGLLSIKTYFWTDATTVLAWIKREDSWNVFVNNRVSEIKRLTLGCEWRFVPGTKNPADLPSRGCSARKLLESQWWEGPRWLSTSQENWPQQETEYNEEAINSEKKRTVISALITTSDYEWFQTGCSTYKKTVRTIGWIFRFKKNCLTKNEKLKGDLTVEEYVFAENKLLSIVQSESFKGATDDKLRTLLPVEDKEGIIRVKTKISNKEDTHDFCYPIVLPSSKHPIVFKLILDVHKDNCHVGSQMILTLLRERFWILGGRRSIKSVLKTCVICKRHTSKHVESIPTPLPLDRVRTAKVFEVTGVDLAGPLYLKVEKGTCKAWVCIFTCSVYRAVHLELLSSLSTDNFLMSLRRFISRRGRPSKIYSDNGTNFTGANNALKNLDWTSIEQYSTVRRIQWKHSPPSGPWWGGWWERLIGIMKKLLRRVLGNSYVSQEEMQTVLCDCEAIINARPLTYVSENPADLTPLTPSLFLQDVEEVGVPDLDLVEETDLNQRLRYRQKLKQDLRERFRTEYLGQLQLHANKNKLYDLNVGEIVLIGSDSLKRQNWPLARIVELIKGKDGNVRLVRLRTQNGELMRPVQRIFPLEIKSNPKEEKLIEERLRQAVNDDESQDRHPKKNSGNDTVPTVTQEPIQDGKITRRGRVIFLPKKYQD